ncbi:hypothetical protein SELMODRAFT_152901 [Selaginella moellendorffii]|uniref:RING-type domain-containing protein n=1 Tax=Selaginella moellendorffii TaxID=88036 RepID=D8S6M7_SELML|nr:hypothetical protein SELMODRAFT_152901 [Selaginella moellendorffii]
MEDFGQKVDLTQRIREVLLNYPEGTTILKEMIQNADDAGASQVCFCVDRRRHAVDSLVSPPLAQWQGPALLAYNNAAFTEEDFQSISRIGDSKKRGQAWKTGRFGIGFNSVYHLSDLPSFVSGSHVVFFDPQCQFLPSISSLNPGKRIDFVTSTALENFPDQFSPYCAFGCDMRRPFGGTLFRFPLRSAEQAATSKLSKQSYTSTDMLELLRDLYHEIVQVMLFLKNVERVEFYEWSAGSSSPTLLYSCAVRLPTSEIRSHRQLFLRLSKGKDAAASEETKDVFRLELVTKAYTGADSGKESLSSFLISQAMGSSASRIGALATNAFKSYGLRLLPWASVAASILPGKVSIYCLLVEGRAFCFLPLPIKTGMPFHVNGYFELSANRRDIWHGSDMDRMGKLRSDWNQCVLEDVAALCLRQLLLEARKLGPGATYSSMWPLGNSGAPWIKLVQHFYRSIAAEPLLHSRVAEGKWLSPMEVLFHDEEYEKAEVLADALVADGLPLVRLPKPLRDAVFKFCDAEFKVVTPFSVRTHFLKSKRQKGPAERSHLFAILDYCLSDLVDEEAAEHLRRLPLVPLQSLGTGRFALKGEECSYFLCTALEIRLFKGIPDKLVDENLPPGLVARLNNIARTGRSNICLIDDTTLAEILQYVLPPEWKNGGEIRWQPGLRKQPSKEWLGFFWEHLAAQQRDLSKLQQWPILPTTTGTLRRPVRFSGILKGGKISSSLEGVFIKAGCLFLDTQVTLDHPQLSRYVLDPTVAEVLDAIGFSAANNLSKLAESFTALSGLERRELRAFLYDVCWGSRNEMNESRLQIFKTLPIFEAYRDLGTRDLVFVSLEGGKKFLPPSGVDETLLGPDCLHSSGSREHEVLTQLLDVMQLKKADFFKWRILSDISNLPTELRDLSMLQILRELPELSVEDRSLVGILKKLSFVPTGAGKFRAPDALYDPEIPELVSILDSQQFFPSPDYSSPDVLQSLRHLGLRSSVTPDTILASARAIEGLSASVPDQATLRGRVLLSYLDKNASKWLQEAGTNWILSILQGEKDSTLSKFWSELANICWCPVLLEPPHDQMPWPVVSQSLAPPRLVRLPSDIWLVSATMRILDGQCDSPGLCQRLGWSSKLSGNILAAQLLELGKGDNFKLRKILATTVPKIYSMLSDMLGSDEMEIVKAILEDRSWIWVGSRFAMAREVVFDGALHLTPYLHVVPADLAAFKELFLELGVKESLDPAGYSTILAVIASEKCGDPLDSRQLAAAIWIVQHLADTNFGEQGKEIVIPDCDGILLPSSQLVYNDAPWLVASKDIPNKKLVHSKISNDVAEKVGIASVRESLLAKSADFVDLGLHGGMEAFGQSESLTSRLKHIVEMYADGPGTLFELLQNADDAGATEVSFLLDKSSFGTNSVLSRQMADWQGPALYCYNDSVFKPEDFYAISRIGQNSKLDKPSAIGRFGLGFNSVYHFTDVPSFVSGSTIVLLDPHADNLPGISPAQPGLKINFVGKELLNQFPDQFESFLLFGCDLQKPFLGTLFRFPLRTTVTAARSEIKQDPYQPEDVVTLFSALKKSAGEVLLFLRHVTSIKLYVRDGLHAEVQEIFKVHRENADYQETSLYEFVTGNTRQKYDKEQFVKRLEKTADKQLPWCCGKIRIEVAAPDGNSSSSWLICSSFGGGNAKEFVISPANRSRGFVPWAGIAARMSEDGSIEVKEDERGPVSVEGRAFCFLPLPVVVGLPIHVNGYFELSANRRDIWYGGDMVGGGKLRSQWNSFLLQDAAAPAYARLLHRASRELGPSASYSSLWPTQSVGEPWKQLVTQVYKAVIDLEVPVLFTTLRGGKWISAKQAVFPDFSFPEMTELGNALVEIGLPLISVPEAVTTRFREVCPSLKFFSPRLLQRLLIASRRTLERRISILALKYSLSDVQSSADESKLYGLALVPLSDGSFGTLNSRSTGEKIILAGGDDHRLLKDALPHMLVDPEVGEDISLKMTDMAANAVSNVYVMTPLILQELLPLVLPLEWSGQDIVTWTPGTRGHPSTDWMLLFWHYIARHRESLSNFESWPLLPTTDDKLVRMYKGGSIIVNDGWSENMTSLLQKSGCFLLKGDLPVQLRDHVQAASAHGILLAFFAAAGGNLKMVPTLLRDCSAFEVRELRHFLFQEKWFALGQMDAVQLQVLKMLRLFESGGDFICIAESEQLIAPDGIDGQLLADMFIQAETGKEEHILQTYLGLKKVDKKDYFASYFVDCIKQVSEGDRMKAFLKVSKELALFIGEMEEAALASLSQLAFVPTGSNAIEAPERLYDPRISELLTLLDRKAFFPAHEFQAADLLDVLVVLGLRKSLKQEGLLDSARSVGMISATDDSEASRRGKALLAHMDGLAVSDESVPVVGRSLSDIDSHFWVELSSISWCPVRGTSPNQLLPWLPGQLPLVASPKLVRPASDIWLVSGAMRILDGDCSSFLQEKLGWTQTLKANVLAHQLIELSKRYSRDVLDEETTLTLSSSVKDIYKLLQGFSKSDEMLIIQSMVEGHAWLWIGDGFIRAKEAAFDSPAHFYPYLHVLPVDFLEFKELFTKLGVRETFSAGDYVSILERVAADVKGDALSPEQLTFVLSVLGTLSEVLETADRSIYESILIPDAVSQLVPAKALVYNDAPWLSEDGSQAGGLRLVHPDVDNNLARQLGARSLRYLSVVDQEMTSSLPCLGIGKINELLAKFGAGGDEEMLLFDLLEVADCCQARKVHFVYDQTDHPKQSLLQPNMSDFQGPALLVAFEGVNLTTEEICSLHTSPPVKFHGRACRYGTGLFGSYQITDLLMVISMGCLYLFDPSGQVLAPALADGRKDPTGNPIGKAFSLQGTGLSERFSDQFHPFNLNEELSLDSTSVTFFRLPLHPGKANIAEKVPNMFHSLKKYASTSILFLKSVEKVVISEQTIIEPFHEVFSVSVGSAFAALRHPFQEKNWRKFQLSNFFGSSNTVTKTHTIDVFLKEDGNTRMTKWLVVQSLSSGQTRDMALDRRYLHYQLTPIAGVAACISVDGRMIEEAVCSHNSILCPLPVTLNFNIPVTIFGNFLPFTAGGRYCFDESLGEYPVKVGMLGTHSGPGFSDDILRATWNRQLLSCVSHSYIELLQELQHLQLIGQASSSEGSSSWSFYSLWPRSAAATSSNDSRCLAKWLIKPMYARLVDMPLWQLHGGSGMVKYSDGVFVAPSGQGVAPKASVSDFLKSHHRIFTVPWELGKEVEGAVGVPMKELKPQALRALMKVPSVAAAVQSLTTQIDLLEYCCMDAVQQSFDVTREGGVPDDLELSNTVLAELKGVTCPTANEFMVKLGTLEVWVASREEQLLLPACMKRFLHPLCLERPLLAALFYNKAFQRRMNLRQFSPQVIAANIWTVLPRSWASASTPSVDWNQQEPSAEWIRNLWTNVDPTSVDDLSLLSAMPLIPATIDSRNALVRVGQSKLTFVPPLTLSTDEETNGDFSKACARALAEVDEGYPWLVSVLGKLGVPVYHSDFTDCRALQCCLSEPGSPLVDIVVSKFLALEQAGFWLAREASLSPDECKELYALVATVALYHDPDENSLSSQELSLLQSLPIYETIRGSYVKIDPAVYYTVSSETFIQPDDEHRLSGRGDAFYQLLGVPNLGNTGILVRYALPNFNQLSSSEQEAVMAYVYRDWDNIKDSAVVNALRSTKFVTSASTVPTNLSSPQELVDPENVLLKQIFAEERSRFPGGRFGTSRWLHILRRCGLCSLKDPALIVECAKKIEELGKRDLHSDRLAILKIETNGSSRNVSDAVWSMAGMLVEEIMNNFAAVYNSNFCDKLSNIAFVPAENGIPSVAGGSPNRVLASYNEAILVKDWPLGWTCCPVLFRPNSVPPQFAWGALHLRSPPLISVVVGQNGGEDVLARWPNGKGSRSVEEVFGEVLSYLSTAWDGLSDSDKKELSLHAFIPVANGTRLVTASSLYTRLGMDLAPYIFEAPRAYLSYVDILSALGMHYDPTVPAMVALLVQLQQTSGFHHLNPNELQAVLSILRFIWETSKKSDLSTVDVVVPDETARLVHASACAYVDAAGARLVENIDTTKLRFVHPSLPVALCDVLHVKKLSEAVLEEIDDSEPLEYVDSLGEYSLSAVKAQLGSNAFACSVQSLRGPHQITEQHILDTLQAACEKLKFVRRLRTKFLLVPSLKDITRAGQHQAFLFISRSQTTLLVAEPPTFIALPDLLAVLVSRLLECSVSLPLGPFFKTGVGDKLDQVARIIATGSEADRQGRDGGVEALLGSSVAPVDARALQFCPLRPFYSGEVVGWHRDGQQSQIKYGRVVEDIRAPAGQPLFRIHVETSPGQVEILSSSNILSFKSTGGGSSASSEQAAVVLGAAGESSEETTMGRGPENLSTSRHEKNEAAILGVAGYAQAITDILTSLGLPLTLERQSLLEHTLSLQEQLNSSNASLLSEQERADAAVQEAETLKSSWTCRICLNSEVNSLLVPCGHVLCHSCCSSLSRCPFCRQFVTSIHRMFRP